MINEQGVYYGDWYYNVQEQLRNANYQKMVNPQQNQGYKSPDHGSTDRKDTTGKLDPFLIPFEAVVAYNKVSDIGFKKYGNRETWKSNSPDEGVLKYLRAMARHAWEIFRGREIDPETSEPHVYAVVWNACAAVWHYERKKKDAI